MSDGLTDEPAAAPGDDTDILRVPRAGTIHRAEGLMNGSWAMCQRSDSRGDITEPATNTARAVLGGIL